MGTVGDQAAGEVLLKYRKDDVSSYGLLSSLDVLDGDLPKPLSSTHQMPISTHTFPVSSHTLACCRLSTFESK